MPRGVYGKLVEIGALHVSEGLRVQPPAQLWNAIIAKWGEPEVTVCDRFRIGELQDCANGADIVPRVTRWSEAAADIRSLRKMALDGPLSCAQSSRALIAASLSAAMVENDKQGSMRLIKRGTNNTGRDDVAAALTLAAGALQTALSIPRDSPYGGLIG